MITIIRNNMKNALLEMNDNILLRKRSMIEDRKSRSVNAFCKSNSSYRLLIQLFRSSDFHPTLFSL